MKNFLRKFTAMLCAMLILGLVIQPTSVNAKNKSRQMENLGRGIVAVRNGSSVFVSWRLLALDSSEIGFNIYRSTEGGKAEKLNNSVLTEGTNYTDTTADLAKKNSYYVRPVIKGKEQDASESFTLAANTADEPLITIPIKSGGVIRFVWVGDFDGDSEYDYLVDRNSTVQQTLEAYKRDGTLLWTVDLGPNSTNQDNVYPGSAAIDVGHWDGVTVYDLDGCGKSEVILKIANGVTFGDGKVWTDSNDNKQWLAVLDGMTGKLKATCPIPDDYIDIGSMGAQLGIGYLNGSTPSVVAVMKNRNKDKSFNMMVCAFSYKNKKLEMDWKWLRGSQNCPDGHQMRIVDVNEDGKDEICEIGFVLNGDGTLRYSLADQGVLHGDRFHVAKLDPNSTGLQGYGIQQNNPNGLLEYYYNADTGEMIWQHTTTPPAGDVSRGMAGDIDPRYPGYEVWSFSGIYNGSTNTKITDEPNRPWPQLNLWWDGDLLGETYNDGKIEEWDYELNKVKRLVSTWKFESARGYDKNPLFYGDILGDWREELILTDTEGTNSKLYIFTTPIPTSTRLYTLAQNPAYRNCMTIKGYMQSNLVDYYLGDGMYTPPTPKIHLTTKK